MATNNYFYVRLDDIFSYNIILIVDVKKMCVTRALVKSKTSYAVV